MAERQELSRRHLITSAGASIGAITLGQTVLAQGAAAQPLIYGPVWIRTLHNQDPAGTQMGARVAYTNHWNPQWPAGMQKPGFPASAISIPVEVFGTELPSIAIPFGAGFDEIGALAVQAAKQKTVEMLNSRGSGWVEDHIIYTFIGYYAGDPARD